MVKLFKTNCCKHLHRNVCRRATRIFLPTLLLSLFACEQSVELLPPVLPDGPTLSLAPTANFLELDGVDDNVQIADAAALDLTGGQLTLEAWINPHSWGENSQGRIVHHGGGSLPAGWTFQIVNAGAGQSALMLQVNNSGSPYVSKAFAVGLNRWQHVAVTLANQVATFYVGGVEQGTVSGVPTPA